LLEKETPELTVASKFARFEFVDYSIGGNTAKEGVQNMHY